MENSQPAENAVPAQAPEPPAQRALRLRAELAEAEAAERLQSGDIAVKVEDPHYSFQFGSVTVTREWTSVPRHMVASLFTAASEAGVTLTQEG